MRRGRRDPVLFKNRIIINQNTPRTKVRYAVAVALILSPHPLNDEDVYE